MERWIIRRTANREKTSDIDNNVSETTDEIPSEKPTTSSTSNINKGQDKRKGKTPSMINHPNIENIKRNL